MINYSSYNDAWGIKPQTSNLLNDTSNDISNDISRETNIEEFNYQDKKVNKISINKKLIKKNNCRKCTNVNDILECDECLRKLKNRLNMIDDKPQTTFIETFTNNIEGFNFFIRTKLTDLCKNKRRRIIILIVLIIIFIVSTFIFIKGRGVKGDGSDADVQVLAEASTEASAEASEASQKYFRNFNNMENFVLVPKSMVKFNNVGLNNSLNNGLTPAYY